MANASVEKLKALGLRHGEKALVGLTATVFIVFTGMAFLRSTLDVKPEQLTTQAANAEGNIQKPQDPKDILARLEEAGLKEPGFVKLVENQQANALKPADYRAKLDWVTPEPGAGLIRDQPELIAPTELAAFPGRGGILMYALNEKGDRILDTGSEPKVSKKKGGAGRKSSIASSGPGSMSGPGFAPPEDTEESRKRAALEAEKRKRSLVGTVDPAQEKEAAKAAETESTEPQGPWKEETRGKRWAVITGVIDNAQMNKNWLQALKIPAIAYPNYKRLDVQRQSRHSDSAWSEWAAVDQSKNYEVLDNIPEIDEEYVPELKRPSSLVDPLPYLRAGYWTGVHVAKLVPAELREAPKANAAPGMGMMPGMMGSSRMPGEMSGPGGTGPGSGKRMGGPGGMTGPGSMGGPGSMSMGGPGAMGGPGSMMGMGGPGSTPEDALVVPNDEPSLMLRSLDFTVEPEATYRFRVRIVVVNPNKDHTDVNPGVDVEIAELLGPWSEPTNEVTVPGDVAAYAAAPEPATRRSDLVSFQVIRWDPSTGQTVLKNDIAGPGEIVGEYGSVPMPSSDGSGTKSANIDFNSRSIVLDTFGGRERLPDIGVERNAFEIPALAMVVQPDGSVAIKSQARDKADAVRQDMDTNYKQALEDSGKKREPGGGSRMPGFTPGANSAGSSR